MRAFFANGVEKMHISWAVEGLPTLLHLSLLLFFGGLVIFLFNVDREVFSCVVSWIGLFSTVYGLITLLPLIRQDSPYYSPLSVLAIFLYGSIYYVTYIILASIVYGCNNPLGRFHSLTEFFGGWVLGGVGKEVEEQSSKIDVGILDWTISALGDDDSLEKFIEAIPGFFDSTLVKGLREHTPHDVLIRLSDAINGFLHRTMSSNSVIDSVKLHRFNISLRAIDLIHVDYSWLVLKEILVFHWDQVPKTAEIWHTLAPWYTSNDRLTAQYAQGIVAKVLWTVRDRDDRWVELAAHVYGLPERDLRDILTQDHDNGSLALLIHLTRRSFRSDLRFEVLEAFTQLDVRNTLSGLQHDFCTLWNEVVQEARNQTPHNVYILREIRHQYLALHQGTDAAPTAFSPSTYPFDEVLYRPSSYPLCEIASHRHDYVPLPLLTQPVHSLDALPGHSSPGSATISRQVNEATIITRPPLPSHPTTPGEIGDTSQAPTATSPTLLDHTSPRPTDPSPPGAVAAALQSIPPVATLFDSLEGKTQRDIATLCTKPENILPAPTLVPVPASTPQPPIKPLESCDPGAASTSGPLFPASSTIGFSIPAPPPSRVLRLPDAESLTLLSSATPSRSTGNAAALPHLRARGLVNTGNMCFANAVFQLLVHSPPFWELFKGLGDPKGPRRAGVPETSDGATPLVDATLKFFEEFMFEEQPPPRQVAGGESREDEDATREHNIVDSFEPMYLYDAMKEKRKLKDLLVRSRTTYCPDVTDSCWPNVYRMVNSRMRKSFSVSTSTRLMKNCSRYSLLPVVTSWPLLHPEQKNARCLS
jgi:Family of unknown function (DUF6535)